MGPGKRGLYGYWGWYARIGISKRQTHEMTTVLRRKMEPLVRGWAV